jgi:hypothetical protein
MNQMTKKLLLSVLTVVLTVIALGTTTFAWFTLTNTATVQPFEAQVVADAGIEVSLDDAANEGVWVTTLTEQMLNDYITAKYTNFYFNHVTSRTGVNMFALGDVAYETPLPVLSGGFLTIGIQVRSQTENTIIWTDVTLSSPSQIAWVSDVAFTNTSGPVAQNQTLQMVAANGARISVTGTTTVVYERSGSPAGTPTGDSTLNTVLGGFTDHDFTANPNLLPGQMNYYFAKTAEYPMGATSVTVAPTVTTLGSGETVLVMTGDGLGTGFANSGLITIRIWLEGWDPDTFNNLLGGVIRASFQFKAPE